ncbi:MAG: hypothetical protein Tsb0020_35360 [Haliangiales bacterium]
MSQVGDRIASRYELETVAGEGGMATVWRARSYGAAGFSRVVAVKEIKSEFGAVQSYIDMFVEEARVGSDLAHPNIVQVYDFLEYRGGLYLVMEWVEGIDLSDFVLSYTRADQATPWELVAAIGIHAMRGLSAAHSRRRPDGVEAPVIHRDVSPTNILLSTAGTVKITDFGLARARDRAYSLTAPGTVKGKLSYLSPEVSYGRAAGPKSDQFSLGSVLWEALTGQQLFVGANDIEIFKRIRACEVPPLAEYRPDIPRDMAAVIHRALARKPAERFPSGAAMVAALTEVLDLRSHTSPWEVEDQLALAVARASTSTRPHLPLPADAELALKSFDADGDPTETGPGRLLGVGRAVVQFAEHPDSDVITKPDYTAEATASGSAGPLASVAAKRAQAAHLRDRRGADSDDADKDTDSDMDDDVTATSRAPNRAVTDRAATDPNSDDAPSVGSVTLELPKPNDAPHVRAEPRPRRAASAAADADIGYAPTNVGEPPGSGGDNGR